MGICGFLKRRVKVVGARLATIVLGLLVFGWADAAPAAVVKKQATPSGKKRAGRKKTGSPAGVPSGAAVSTPPRVEDLLTQAPQMPICKPLKGKIPVEIKLPPVKNFPELLSWATGFSCATFSFTGGDKQGPPSSASQGFSLVTPTSSYTPKEAWDLFLSLLSLSGYYLVPASNSSTNRLFTVVSFERAPVMGAPLVAAGRKADLNEQYATQVFDLKGLPSSGLREIVMGILGTTAKIQLSQRPNGGGFLVASAPSRLLRNLYEALDFIRTLENSSLELQTIPVGGANGAELATALNDLLAGGPISKIFYQKDCACLILRADKKSIGEVVDLVKQIGDRIVRRQGSNIIQLELKYTTPKKMKDYLDGLKGGSVAGPGFSCLISMLEEKSIIGFSCNEPSQLASIMRAILSADIDGPQIMFATVVFEVNANALREVSVGFGGVSHRNGSTLFGSTELYGTSTQGAGTYSSPLSIASLAAMAGANGGFIGPLISSGPLAGLLPFSAVLHLLARNNSGIVREQPTLLCSVGSTCKMIAGSNLPIPGALTNLGTQTQAGQSPQATLLLAPSIQREDFAVKETITPIAISRGSDGRYVAKVKIELTIAEVGDPNYNGQGPEKKKKEFEVEVYLTDGEPVVLGGLSSNKIVQSKTKIPILGDIPILGYLFRSTQKRTEERTLVVVMTPYVVKDRKDFARVYNSIKKDAEIAAKMVDPSYDVDLGPPNYVGKKGALAEIGAVIEAAEKEKLLQDLSNQGNSNSTTNSSGR